MDQGCGWRGVLEGADRCCPRIPAAVRVATPRGTWHVVGGGVHCVDVTPVYGGTRAPSRLGPGGARAGHYRTPVRPGLVLAGLDDGHAHSSLLDGCLGVR